jgi:hypothetical protein
MLYNTMHDVNNFSKLLYSIKKSLIGCIFIRLQFLVYYYVVGKTVVPRSYLVPYSRPSLFRRIHRICSKTQIGRGIKTISPCAFPVNFILKFFENTAGRYQQNSFFSKHKFNNFIIGSIAYKRVLQK